MLDEYILTKVDEITQSVKELEQKLDENIKKQNEYNRQINEMAEMQDIGMELFSPRMPVNASRKKMDDVRLLIDELQLQETQLREEIENYHKKEEKLRAVLTDNEIELQKSAAKEEQKEEKQNHPEAQTGHGDDISIAAQKNEDMILEQLIQRPKIGEDELQLLLRKVEEARKYSMVNPQQCRSELDNVCYYIKALITRVI